MLAMPFDGARQGPAFNIAANGNIVLGSLGMGNPLDGLVDNRPLVQVACHIMRRRADQFDAALMGLGLGVGAVEAGQETVMNVDDAPGQRPAKPSR